jgi:hypothetical protein
MKKKKKKKKKNAATAVLLLHTMNFFVNSVIHVINLLEVKKSSLPRRPNLQIWVKMHMLSFF